MKCPYCAIDLTNESNTLRDAGGKHLRYITCGNCYTCSSWVRKELRGWTTDPETNDGLSRTESFIIP